MPRILLILFMVSGSLFAQQRPAYSLYFQNMANVNPGYAGLDNALSITGVIRNQWSGIVGNPRQQVISAHMPYDLVNGGIGLIFEADETGLRKNTRTQLQYSYYLTNSANRTISIGLGLGVQQISLDGSGYRTPTGSYSDGTAIDHNDQLLTNQMENGLTLFSDIGIYYRDQNWEGGLSVKNLNAPSAKINDYKVSFERNFHLYGSYRYELNRKVNLIANLAFLSNLQQNQIVGLASAQINENFTLGIGLRGISELDALILQGGIKLNEKWKLFYAYDSGLSSFSNALGGSHEIGLNFNINKRIGGGVPPRIIYSPRFL